MKKLIWALVLSFAVLSATGVVAEPTVKEIYQTAQVDKQQALTMVNEVIKNRPNSARAHFIQSELLLQLGKRSEAKNAFLKAQSLDPALSFVKPESVDRLRSALGIKKPQTGLSVDTDKLIMWLCALLLVILIGVLVFKRKKPDPSVSSMSSRCGNGCRRSGRSNTS
jgi:tetratricopeptide (TPR) repeat protein